MLKDFQIIPVFFLLFIYPLLVTAQFQSDLYTIPEDTIPAPGKFKAGLHASGFFNNKEFFGAEVEGYTLTGNYFQPFLTYDITRDFSIKAGTQLLWYHGQDKLKQALPVFTISYEVIPDLIIRLGSFNKGSNLRLSEPLYMFEYQFSDLLGNGVEILKRGTIWESVTWLDWLTFIEPGDTFREEFIFGHSGNFRIWEKGNHELRVPFYLLANHKGGQINTNDEPVETRFDIGTGIKYMHSLSCQVFNRFSLMTDYYHAKNIESNPDGNALFAFSELSGDLLTTGLGYFHGKNWESIMGEPLLFSPMETGQSQDLSRNFLLVKAGIGKKITPGSSFMLRFEGYYDMVAGKFQYSYGIHLMVNEWRVLGRNRKLVHEKPGKP